ncbi:hypothetical protein Hanom_Chr10g00910781 [Helianthus anomalus]
MGFYSFGLHAAKRILINPHKSFHDWKIFFIREEVIPVAMIFRKSDKIEKKELPIPKTTYWYLRLLATPNRIFKVAAGMSDKWPAHSKEVPVLMFEGEVYKSTFPTFRGAMGVRPLGDDEVFWYEQIKNNFLYPPAGIFASPPTANEGAQLPKPRRDFCWEKDSLSFQRGVRRLGGAAASKSSGSAGSRAPESGATPSSLHEEEEEEVEEEGARLVTKKRSREETTGGETPPARKAFATQPIGKTRGAEEACGEGLRSRSSRKPSLSLSLRIRSFTRCKETFLRGKPHTHFSPSLRYFSCHGNRRMNKCHLEGGFFGKWKTSKKVMERKFQGHDPALVRKTHWDIYYKTYNEEQRGEEKHVPVWSLKKKDTFVDFEICRDWFLGTFTPGEVKCQRARNHESLYHAYIVGEANTATTNHQIVHKWEKYRERMLTEAREFEQITSVELNAQIVNKNKDLAQIKRESLEIDLAAEKVKADTAEKARKAAEEARHINTSALNVVQNNYAEAQSIVDTLVSESEWMRNHMVCHCSVTDQADEVLSLLRKFVTSLPVMELVKETLKHDDYVARLCAFLTVPETVELLDEEEAAGDGGGEYLDCRMFGPCKFFCF